jgi:hypothetical protein
MSSAGETNAQDAAIEKGTASSIRDTPLEAVAPREDLDVSAWPDLAPVTAKVTDRPLAPLEPTGDLAVDHHRSGVGLPVSARVAHV